MNYRSITLAGVFALSVSLAIGTLPVRGQDAGPMKPPAGTKLPRPLPPSKPDPPPISPEEIISRFAAREDEMLRAITGYSFQKSVRLEEIGPDNKPTGQMEIVTQQVVGSDGRLYEKPVRRAASTLHYLQFERGDADLTVATPLFPLTTPQLSKYEIGFQGKQQLDELSVYIFSVQPRLLDRTHPYFSGVVWVDEQDFVIVKTIGKWVTDTGDVTSSSVPFAIFETYRQQVGKNQWFPAYSRSDESILAGDVRVPIRMVIRWSDYTPLGNTVPGAPAAAPSGNKNTP